MGILITGIVILGFGLVALVAILSYVTGESIRAKQREDVERYVAERLEHLKALQERRHDEEETEQDHKEAERKDVRTLLQNPEDQQLSDNMDFMKQVAVQSPATFASVVRTYISGDPAAATHAYAADLAEPSQKGE